MQRILNLIEATLDAEITPAELAAQSGYSLWHFLHLFQQEVGMPLGRYMTRRRLAHAIWHISCGMNVTDAALGLRDAFRVLARVSEGIRHVAHGVSAHAPGSCARRPPAEGGGFQNADP